MSWFFGSTQGANSSQGRRQLVRLGSSSNGTQSSRSPMNSKGSPVSPIGDVDKETNRMFQEHTVEGMKELEKKTRLDIDRRREDLRQMVGERYRDLIDAADSIVDMQKCSQQVKESVELMDGVCQKLQQTHFLRGAGGARRPAVKNVAHEETAQLKFLFAAPEQIWACLERHGYLEAAQHFLLARHIYSQLGVGVAAGPAPTMARTPAMLQRMWQSVAGFKEVILECCSQHLRSPDLAEESVVESLCAVVLLEGCTVRQTFNHFLVARKAAVQMALGSASQLHRSVKNQVLHLVKIILHSLLNIAAIFCQHRPVHGGRNEPSRLLQKLLQFKETLPAKPLSGGSARSGDYHMIPEDLLPLLPKSVSEFRPVLRSSVLMEVPTSDIHNSTSDWINMCCTDVVEGLGQLLQHVSSIKALASIKSAVYALLSDPPTPAADDATNDLITASSERAQWEELWKSVCGMITSKEVNIWETFFGPCLLKRVHFLLDKKLGAAGNHASSRLTDLLSSMASDPDRFQDDVQCHTHLWSEHAHQDGWQKGGKRDEMMLNLTLKCKACTPSIYRFCQNLSSELESLIEDLNHYMQPGSSHFTPPAPLPPYSTWQQGGQPGRFPFHLNADSLDLQHYVQKATMQWVTRFLQSVEVKVNKLQHMMKTSSEDGGGSEVPQLMDRLLMVGRLCGCMMECTPPLLHLLGAKSGAAGMRSEAKSGSDRRLLGQTSQQRLSVNKEVEDTIAAANNLILEKTNFIFRLWADRTVGLLVEQLRANLLADVDLHSLSSVLAWSEIRIKEESESGQEVSSVIHIPCHPSVYITSLFFALGREVGRIGGHVLDRSILRRLSGTFYMGVVDAYREILSNREQEGLSLSQPCALQLFFNLRFLTNILCVPEGKEEDLSQQVKSINEALQAFVDPFDLDVFMPYLLSNLENQLSRLPVMYGVLLTVKGSSAVPVYKPQPSGVSSQKGQQDKPIPLPLAPGMGRIPSLPISSKPSQQHKISRIQEPASASSIAQTISFFYHL